MIELSRHICSLERIHQCGAKSIQNILLASLNPGDGQGGNSDFAPRCQRLPPSANGFFIFSLVFAVNTRLLILQASSASPALVLFATATVILKLPAGWTAALPVQLLPKIK